MNEPRRHGRNPFARAPALLSHASQPSFVPGALYNRIHEAYVAFFARRGRPAPPVDLYSVEYPADLARWADHFHTQINATETRQARKPVFKDHDREQADNPLA